MPGPKFVFLRAVFHLLQPGVPRRFFQYPLFPGREKRLNRFDSATSPCLLLFVQHLDSYPPDAQKVNLSREAGRRARFALEDLSQVPFPLLMLAARERSIIKMNSSLIQPPFGVDSC